MDIQAILNTLQPELASIVICVTVGAAAYLYQWGVQRLPANLKSIVQGLAGTVVQATEQKYSLNSPGGTLKKQEAMTALAQICKDLRIPLANDYASAAIEAAVYVLNLHDNFTRQTSQPTPKAPPAG